MENTHEQKQTGYKTIKAYFANGQSLVMDVNANMSSQAILDYFLYQTFNLTPSNAEGAGEILTKCIKVEVLS